MFEIDHNDRIKASNLANDPTMFIDCPELKNPFELSDLNKDDDDLSESSESKPKEYCIYFQDNKKGYFRNRDKRDFEINLVTHFHDSEA